MNRTLLQLGATFMFFGVAFGAFGAHLLKESLSASSLAIWQTAVQYQLIHGVAILALAALPEHKVVRISGTLFSVGIGLFSGSLYILAVSGVKWLGAITPLGGLMFLSAWLLLAVKSGTLFPADRSG